MTSASDEKWRHFNFFFFSRDGLRTCQHPCIINETGEQTSCLGGL